MEQVRRGAADKVTEVRGPVGSSTFRPLQAPEDISAFLRVRLGAIVVSEQRRHGLASIVLTVTALSTVDNECTSDDAYELRFTFLNDYL